MKYKLRMTVCGVLTAVALTCAFTALAAPSGMETQALAAENDQGEGFVLRAYDGYIGIFYADAEKTPMALTDIEVRNLRDTDQALLEAGIHTASYEKVMELLEDLGS